MDRYYALLADLVVLLHLAFVLFVVLGGLLALRWRGVIFIHLPAVAWGIWIELSGGICPLTPLENSLRRAGGQAGYDGGFIEYYIEPLLYPSWLEPATQLALASAVLIMNALIYGTVWRHRRP